MANFLNTAKLRPKGFVLWEVMLALTIFCIVAVALTSALHQIIDTSILIRDESQVRIELQNALAQSAVEKLKVGKSGMSFGDPRIHYEREIRSVVAKTAKGAMVTNLYEVIVRANWQSSGRDRSEEARTILYRP